LAQDIHSPAELLEILEKSTNTYELNRLEVPIEFDGRVVINSNTSYRKKEGDGFIAVEVELGASAKVIKEEAEELFQKKEYEQARLLYEKLLQMHPEYTKLLVYIGQTYHLEGEVQKAIPFYTKAVEQNFIDYMGHWFLGRALWDIGEVDDCLALYMVAHLLNRNHPLLTKELIKVLAVNGLEYNEWRFIPQIELNQIDSTTMVVTYASGWEGYAIAKAVWAFERSHSEKMGQVFGVPSMVQEQEALLAFYLTHELGNKKLSKAPFVKAFKYAVDNKQVEAFILYEIFLVQEPSIAYQLSLDNFIYLSEYVIDNHCTVIKGKKKRKKKKKKQGQ
jgi:tetratricopeptide (TPR) repeat protein